MNKNSYLVEAVSGKWLRLPADFRTAGCVVDLPGGIALNVSKTSSRIEIYAKAEDQVYYYSGEMVLHTERQPDERAPRISCSVPDMLIPGF